MENAFGLPDVEHEQFERPPLKAMLGQVRFPTVLRLAEPAGLASFQEVVRDEFPEFREEQQFTVMLGDQAVPKPTTQRLWRFLTSDSAWSVVIAPDFLTLEASAPQYTDYKDFRERFEWIWGHALEQFRPARRLQQGLRYVDHLEKELRGPEWKKWINPELLGAVAVDLFASHLEHSLTDLRLTLADGQLSFKHGVVRAGPTAAPGYLLDFDCFTQESNDDLEIDTVLDLFDSYHDTIWRLFRWSVTPAAVEEFRRAGS